jgi:FMN phosphatase YigB (HAD superfamily)
MKKFLYSNKYKQVDIIGLDLDGTLYDEFDFIYQVYNDIVDNYKCNKEKKEQMLYYMLNRWFEKGSSYASIFYETKNIFNLNNDFDKYALSIFRTFDPKLQLSVRIKFMLEKFKKDNKRLFLLTDGKMLLQNKKIASLGIRDYFELILIAEKNQKPDPYYSKNIKDHFGGNQKIIYIGDRKKDEKFAKNSEFDFLNIIYLNPNFIDI